MPSLTKKTSITMENNTQNTNTNYRELHEFSHRSTPDHIRSLKDNEIFVFGSNLQGMHGGGAARVAVDVEEFIQFAQQHPELTFLVTKIGCGIAGFTPQEIALLFAGAVEVENIHLPEDFWKELV